MKLKFQKPPKRERQQLKSRSRLGQLEKHKDYQVRSRKQHQKNNAAKYYNELIRNKNPDEYHSDMKFSRKNQKTGTTVISRLPNQEGELKKMKKTQKKNLIKTTRSNISLLETREQILRRKIEKLKQELNFTAATTKNKRKHRVFVNSREQLENFSAEDHFQTPLLGQTHRYTLDDLLEKDLSEDNPFRSDARSMKKYNKLKKYLQDLKVIQDAESDIHIAQQYITQQDKIDSVQTKEQPEEQSIDEFYKQMRREESLFDEEEEEEQDLPSRLKNVETIKFKRIRQK